MTNKSATPDKELIAVFTESGLYLDTEIAGSKQYYNNDKLLADFQAEPYKALLYFGFEDKPPHISQSLQFVYGIVSLFIERLSRNPDVEVTRSAPAMTLDDGDILLKKVPYTAGCEFVDLQWLNELWNKLNETFESEISNFDGTAAQFLLAHGSRINVAGRVFFHLVESKSDEYPFAFLATYSRKQQGSDKAEHVPLGNALIEYKDNQELLLKMLSTVSRAADKSAFVGELVESGELFSPLRFTAGEAYTFLKEIPIYEECGIMCRIPDWWKKKYNTVKVSITIGEKPPSQVGLDALLSYRPSLVVDGEEFTREELEYLISQTEGLSFLKGKWVEVDHAKLKEVLDAFEKTIDMSSDMTLMDAMRMQMGIAGKETLFDDNVVEITNGQWLKSLTENLKSGVKLKRIKPGKEFKAKLREYQQTGLDWLAVMKSIGFGAPLADDMGLGKTVQVLALLEHLRIKDKPKDL